MESSLFDNEQDEFLKHIKPIDENFISELQTPSETLQKALALSGRGVSAHYVEKYRPLFAKPSFEGDLGTFGKFRIITEIGYGGMGMVFDAYDTLAHRRIALKTLRPDLLGNQTLRGLFLDEARMAACLEHPSIIKVLEVDEILGVPYFTMPLIKGESLDQFLSLQTSPISRKLFDHLSRQLLEALVYLHEKKIVHRDIKPSNIMLSDESEIKLIDFIKEVYKDKIISKDRSILKNLELDIYLPKIKLAIELNGLYWHSELYKNKNYHLNKTKLCEEKGITLLHIFEDEWLEKLEIVKSIIKNKLNLKHKNIEMYCIELQTTSAIICLTCAC
jgi:serine/threonine protein kinase